MFEFLAGLITLGAVTAAIVPDVLSNVDQAEMTHLNYAKSTLASSLQVNWLRSSKTASSSIVLEGKSIPLTYGYPTANADSLAWYASLSGFMLDEVSDKTVRIHSPQNRFCFEYHAAEVIDGQIVPATLGDIQSSDSGLCG